VQDRTPPGGNHEIKKQYITAGSCLSEMAGGCLLFIVLGFTFCSSSMTVGSKLGNGLDLSGYHRPWRKCLDNK